MQSKMSTHRSCSFKLCNTCNKNAYSSHITLSSIYAERKIHEVFASHFSQFTGQEGATPVGEIPIVAKLKPLSAKEIKPLLKPEEKSKVEETCESLKAKQQAETSKTFIEAMDEAFPSKKTEPEPVKKSIAERIVHEVKHYANGFRLLFINIRISVKQLWKILNGQDLSRRERKLVRVAVNCKVIWFALHILFVKHMFEHLAQNRPLHYIGQK